MQLNIWLGENSMPNQFHHLARAVFIQNNKVLLAQATGHTNTFLPGGHIEFGESAKDALIREIEEELGIKCEVVSFLGLVEHKWEKIGILNCEINQVFEVKSDELIQVKTQNQANLILSFSGVMGMNWILKTYSHTHLGL
jgi:8-oxo-dGTP pyrophosphatase MutT (NUDIX family)